GGGGAQGRATVEQELRGARRRRIRAVSHRDAGREGSGSGGAARFRLPRAHGGRPMRRNVRRPRRGGTTHGDGGRGPPGGAEAGGRRSRTDRRLPGGGSAAGDRRPSGGPLYGTLD